MIPNQWYAVLESRRLLAGRPTGVRRLGEKLVLWRDSEGRAVCMEDRCAHRGTALSIGKVEHGRIRCPYHGFRYDSGGQCVHIPCNGTEASVPRGFKVPTYDVREGNGYVYVWWGEERREYPPLPWIEDVPQDPRVSITRSEIWPFNYARLIENTLDAHHWAFLHGSIMVGVGERLEQFKVAVKDDLIRAEGTLRRTNSKPGRSGWPFRLAYRVPNVNMVQVTPRFRSLIFTTPVDEFTSWVSVRSFQTYSRIPPLRQMVDLYCIRFLFAVPQYQQDFPVFHHQSPRFTGLGVSKLVKADLAIAEYLKMRERLIKQAKEGNGDTRRLFDRDLGTWNPSLNGEPATRHHDLAQPVTSLLPEGERNAHLGTQTGLRRQLTWLRNFASYPALLPSVILTKVRDRLDGI